MGVIEELPNDCWMHIFGFMDIKEVKKYSLSISQNLAERFLESDDHNSIYRLLSEIQMRKDLENALLSIENRKQTEPSYYYARNNRKNGLPSVSRTNTASAGLSTKQMRENLKYCTIRAKYLFSSWFKEDPSLDERITIAFTQSFMSSPIYIPSLDRYDVTQQTIDTLTKLKEEEDQKLETKLINFLTDLEKQVETQKKKHPKWKQIWNGHYIQNSFSNFKESILDIVVNISKVPTTNRRHRPPVPTIDEFKEYLTNIYEGLKKLPTETRRENMFKNFKFGFKYYSRNNNKYETSKSSLFSQIVTGVYKFSKKMPTNINAIESIYEKLIILFVEESIAYKVETPILVDCFMANNSPIHMLLRTTCFPELGLKIVRKYARFIRATSLDFRVFLLVKCFSNFVDLRIINELFYNGTLNDFALSHLCRKNTLALYFLSAVNRKGYSSTGIYYFADLFNIFVKCISGNIGASFTATTPSETQMPTLLWTNNQKLKQFLEPTRDYQSYYGGDGIKFFLRVMNSHYQRFCDKKASKMLTDDSPLDEYVHFERPKHGDLNNFRRRKY